MKNFKKLIIWQKSKDLAVCIFKQSKDWSRYDPYTLIDQIKRSAVSIPSNIAEGSGRGSEKDYLRFTDYALGSSFELETQLLIAKEAEIIPESEVDNLLETLDHIQASIVSFNKLLR